MLYILPGIPPNFCLFSSFSFTFSPNHPKISLVSWCFKPSQSQGIISELKTNFSLPPSYSFHKSLYYKSLFLKPKLKLYPQFRNAKPEAKKNNDTCFGAYLHSAGTQHGNLHQLSVTLSRVTYFILRSNTGTYVGHSHHRKYSGKVLEKMQVNGLEG